MRYCWPGWPSARWGSPGFLRVTGTTADPLVSMATGAAFLHEKIAAAPLDLAAEGLALAVMIGGIIALAQRAPQVAQTPDAPGGTAETGLAAGQSAILIAFCRHLTE